MRKSDITFRRTGNGYGEGRATVCIKVPYQSLDRSIREVVETWGEGVPATMTEEWVRENVSEDTLDAYFWQACESEYEYFCDWADEILPGTTFEVDGRSGGWAVSNWDEDDVAGWDAVKVAQWGKIERVAREIAHGVNGQVVLRVYEYHYSPENVALDGVPIEEALYALSTAGGTGKGTR